MVPYTNTHTGGSMGRWWAHVSRALQHTERSPCPKRGAGGDNGCHLSSDKFWNMGSEHGLIACVIFTPHVSDGYVGIASDSPLLPVRVLMWLNPSPPFIPIAALRKTR